MIGELTNHLWQSTFYAIAVGMLALAFRGNRAQVRYWLWLSASLKFFVPFSLLISLGSHLAWTPAAKATATQAVSLTIVQITQPFPVTLSSVPSTPHATNWLLVAVLSGWVCGFGVIALIRFKDWLGIRAAVRSSAPLDIPAAVAVRSSASLLEPGVVGLNVFGVSRPALLLPEGILNRLTPAQLEAVFAHELCHVRRRDNLTAALHMIVEAVFWFHPMVWWIGARLVEERERACDEEVLQLGNDPQVYAQGILNVCKFYVESPVRCVSGVTGSDVKKRIHRIMKNQFGTALSARKLLLLATAGAAVLAVPVAAGVVATSRLSPAPARLTLPALSGRPTLDVASIKPRVIIRNVEQAQSAGQATSAPPPAAPSPAAQSTTTPAPTRAIAQAPETNAAAFQSVAIQEGNGGFGIGLRPGRFLFKGYLLRQLIAFGYDVQSVLISGPDALDAQYDVDASAPGAFPDAGDKSFDAARAMVRNVLDDRFHLQVHHGIQSVSAYVLSAGSANVLIKVDEEDGRIGLDPTSISGHGIRMNEFVELLSERLGRPVLDQTGLTQTYDFHVDWKVNASPGTPETLGLGRPTPEVLASALQTQLGLTLKSTTAPVDVLVVDHVEEPSPN